MSRNNPRKSSRSQKSKTKQAKSPSASKKGTADKQPEPETNEAREAANIRFLKSYANIKKKWVDETTRKHWPLADIMYGGNRIVNEDGCQTIIESLADCALLEGDERKDPVLLKKGIVIGHFLTCRKTDKGVICEDGNHKLKVFREIL